MIVRTRVLEKIRAALARSSVVVLTGPRQAGKTAVLHGTDIAADDAARG